MTKAELVAAIAQKTGLKQAQAKHALDAMLLSVTETLKAGDDVRLVGFGSFSPVERKAGMARNPRTGAAVSRPASRTARFRAGDTLRNQLK
jgi:DNA-binding protein HU-beta